MKKNFEHSSIADTWNPGPEPTIKWNPEYVCDTEKSEKQN